MAEYLRVKDSDYGRKHRPPKDGTTGATINFVVDSFPQRKSGCAMPERFSPSQECETLLGWSVECETGSVDSGRGGTKNQSAVPLSAGGIGDALSPRAKDPNAQKLYVISDHDSIHSPRQLTVSLAMPAGQRLELHVLPPPCADDHKLERTWQDLPANFISSHTRQVMPEPMTRLRTRHRHHQKQ